MKNLDIKCKYHRQLEKLVEKANIMRQTPIVDDDFPKNMHYFDSELHAAEHLLKTGKIIYE